MWPLAVTCFVTIYVAIIGCNLIFSEIKREKAEAAKHLAKTAILLAREVDTLNREIEQIRKRKAKVW